MSIAGVLLILIGILLEVLNFALGYRRVFEGRGPTKSHGARFSSIILLPALLNIAGAFCFVSLDLGSRLALVIGFIVLHLLSLTGMPWLLLARRRGNAPHNDHDDR